MARRQLAIVVAINVIPNCIPSMAAISPAAPQGSSALEETHVPRRLSWSNADQQHCRVNIILLLVMGTRDMALCRPLREEELLASSTVGFL